MFALRLFSRISQSRLARSFLKFWTVIVQQDGIWTKAQKHLGEEFDVLLVSLSRPPPLPSLPYGIKDLEGRRWRATPMVEAPVAVETA